MNDKTIEILLPNDYAIFIDNCGDAGILIGLINPNGYVVSDRTLIENEIESLNNILV